METLYFLLPLCAVVAIIVFAIARVNSSSYLHRRIDAPHPSKTATTAAASEDPARVSMEQRYVDWFTSDRTTKARDRALHGQDDEVTIDPAITPSGQSYQPSESAPRVIH